MPATTSATTSVYIAGSRQRRAGRWEVTIKDTMTNRAVATAGGATKEAALEQARRIKAGMEGPRLSAREILSALMAT